jgi:hypothetical protein
MKATRFMRILISFVFTVLTAGAAFGQGTAFNFQGRLNDGTSPANGRYDLQFRLYNAIAGGTPVGTEVARPNTILINGVFSTTLDFGAAAFNNPNSVFIEIGIRPAASPNAFTILGPRQQLTAVPFAIRAASAANADNAQNAVNAALALNAINSQNAENATNATSAVTAANALSLGGVSPASFAKLDVINPGQLIINGNVRQSVNAYGLAKAMIEVSATGAIVRCYNGATNSTTAGCGFVITEPLDGVRRINFGFPISNNFVSVTPLYTTTGNSTGNTGANYRLFDGTSMEVFTFSSVNSADTQERGFTLILF